MNVNLLSILLVLVPCVSVNAQPALIATPSTGELGSIIELSVVPQTPGYELTSETNGAWFGAYTSSVGTSPIFATTYEGMSISIIDDWTAQILLGTGVHVSKGGLVGLSDLALLAPNGTLNGSFQLITPAECQVDLNGDGRIDFFDISAFLMAFSNLDPIADFTEDGMFNFFDISAFLIEFGNGCGPVSIVTEGAVSMGFTVDPPKWHHIHYPGGWTSGAPAELLHEISDDLDVFRASQLPALPQNDSILGLSGMIYSVVLDVESNTMTNSGSPSVITVDVFAVDSTGTEIDRITSLPLQNLGEVGGRVRFSSLALKNVLLTDVFVDDAPYNTVRTLVSADDGQIYVVLSIGE